MRGTRVTACTKMNMCASAANRPALFGRKDPVGRTDSPLGDGLKAVSGTAQQGDGARCSWKQTAQALRDEAKDFFPGGAGLEEASEFADLGNFGSLAMGIVKQETDFLVRGRQLFLRGLALRDFLLLVELRKGQPQGESDERCSDRHVCESRSVHLFPTVHQQIDAAEHRNQYQVGDEEAEEVRGLRSGRWLGGRVPSKGDESGNDLRDRPAQVKPCGGGYIVVQVDPVTDEGCDRAEQQKESQPAQQTSVADDAGKLQAH